METSVMSSNGREGLYSPLRDDGSQIRLFRIRPQSNGDMLSYELQTFDVDTAPAYKALSYAWGEPTNADILVNDIVKPIRVSLTGLLANMKNMHEACWLWADQLCINQDDTNERNSQVQMMDRIYKNAKETIIYLGEEPPETTICPALAVLDRFLQRIHDGQDMTAASILDKDELLAVEMLIRAPYWTRHWVIQELILSKNKTIMYGSDSMSFRSFGSAVDGLPLISTSVKAQLMSLLDLEYFVASMGIRLYDEQLIWGQCMTLASRSYCHDVRDKIYGIQSLLPLQLRVPVDYSLSVEEAFIRAVLHWATDSPLHSPETPDHPVIPLYVCRLGIGMHIQLRNDFPRNANTFFNENRATTKDDRKEMLRQLLLEHIVEWPDTDGENPWRI